MAVQHMKTLRRWDPGFIVFYAPAHKCYHPYLEYPLLPLRPMFITCKCVALRSIPVIFSSRHYAKWNRQKQASVGIKMQFCSPASPEGRGWVPCMCVGTQVTYREAHIPSCIYVDLAHTMINIRNVAALHDTGNSVPVFKRKIRSVPFEEWVTGWRHLPHFIVECHWWYFHLPEFSLNQINSL